VCSSDLWELLSGTKSAGRSLVWIENPLIEFGIVVDPLSVLMSIMVSFLSMLIVIYSVGYMGVHGHRSPEHVKIAPHTEEQLPRYYAEISLFIGSMLGLVISDNYLQMYIFWELVGLCSYLLIGFWYTKPEAAAAAKKAFLVTRLGDIFFRFGIAILCVNFRTFNIEKLAFVIPTGWAHITLVSLLIFGGAVGKSAQFPLQVWLPDAMEGPTTVSALIHAATMVKAGVFLVARSFPIFIKSPDALIVVAVIGAITAFIAASMALVQTDIKKVLAYSTISQLGYMMLALGTGLYVASGFTAGMLHLLNHAIFKALLFLCAGSVIHAVATNEMTKMGGLSKKMKWTSLTMLIGSLSIAGFPFFSGFFSKDLVLESTYEAGKEHWVFYLLFFLAVLTAFMTAFYMFRMWFMTFTGRPRSAEAGEAHESPKIMTVPLLILAGLAVVSGYVLFAGFVDFLPRPGVLLGTFADTEFHAPSLFDLFASWITWLSILLTLCGIDLAYRMYYNYDPSKDAARSNPVTKGLHRMLVNKYWMDDFYLGVATKVGYGFALLSDWFDRKVIDGIVNGMSEGAVQLSDEGKKIQTGLVQNYAAVIVTGVCALIFLAYLLIFLGVV
jgi:NADH-quinone oxidoreductase subunit L